MRHLIDPLDFSQQEITSLLDLADRICADPAAYQDVAAHKKLATLFYEPSTRTRLSFEAAMLNLGGHVLGFPSETVSSASKGESVADTIRVVSCYADIVAMRDQLDAYVQDMGPLLAICGSYQMLGREWLVDGEKVPGLGLVGMTTGRPGTSGDRLVSNIALRSPLADDPVVGYENHAGRTYLGEGVEGFGRVVSSCGHGNNDDDRVEGARYKNVVGTYSHGPLLSKNPEVADWLLARALDRRAGRPGPPAADLAPLDDGAELAANASMVKRLS